MSKVAGCVDSCCCRTLYHGVSHPSCTAVSALAVGCDHAATAEPGRRHWRAGVWRLEQARELVQLCQVSLPAGHTLQPHATRLAGRLQLYAEALARPEVTEEFK